MAQDKGTTILMLVVFGFILQVVFIFADMKETPGRVAVGFTKAYFQLDESMGDYLCKDQRSKDGVDVVKKHIDKMNEEARQTGYAPNYMKMGLYNIESDTLIRTSDFAKVHIKADKRRAINPAFMLVAKIFHIGKVYPVEIEIEVVREDNHWRVCGEDLLAL
ncbi:MAG: hypothetical protein K9L30_01745 [Desulfobacterales bacterium]|nr:hypothetical protein [Desulfobacterales bacterium]